MPADSVAARFHLARTLASLKPHVAEAITDEFFLNHPDWTVRYGERGRQHCTTDACFHLDFLAGAIEAGSPEAFADYARWTVRMLGARGIGAHTLEENFAQVEKHLSTALGDDDRKMVSTFLMQGRTACAEPEPASDVLQGSDRLSLTRRIFLAAILNGQRQAALTVVEEALRDGNSLVEIYIQVFAESLHRVGQLWELNEISVAQEHMATSITQYAIAAVYPRLVPATVPRGSMVITGVAGELHQIGANLVADAMEANGWTVRFLGTNLPHSSVISAVEESSANVLCISTTIVANLPSVAELVEAVRAKLSDRCPQIVLGGSAYRLATEFAREIGTMGAITDLRQALAVLCA